MKKTICLLLAVLMLLSLVPQADAATVAETGSCGENATYTLYSDGRLVIGGSGSVRRQAFAGNTNIRSVEIGNGISALEDEVFTNCTAIKTVDFGTGLKSIGAGAFQNCDSLVEVEIPDQVTSLNGGVPLGTMTVGAFSNCDSLKRIALGKGITFLPYGLLESCKSLEGLTIPEHITAIDAYALSFCPVLTYLEIPAGVTYIGTMAFVNDFSLNTVVFRGSVPTMENSFYCGSFNSVGFYPKDDPTWADAENCRWKASLEAVIPYTLDDAGNVIPEAPVQEEMDQKLVQFQTQKRPAGSSYPAVYSYILNGTYLTASGDEAFAFQLSDALFGFLPISELRDAAFEELRFGDILYFDDGVWVITALTSDGLEVAGVDENELVVYGRTMTGAEAETALGYRTRYGISPSPGMTDPALEFELTDLPTELPTPEQVYEKILSLKEQYPEGYPYNLKNHYYSKTESPTWEENGMMVRMSEGGHGCSAFAFMVSDLCFGNLPARYIPMEEMDYDDLMVGDSLIGFGHQVVILEVHPEYLVVVEGNYDEIVHWGRTLTREEVQGQYDVYTRWPAAYPFTDVPEEAFYCEPVIWAVENEITNGVSATEFGPGTVCNRAQVVTFLWRAAGSPEPAAAGNPFVDVQAGSFYEKAVLWAVEKGITTGTDATHFSPDAACNRATVVTFLYRAFGEPAADGENPFADVPADSWCAAPVIWAVEQGITSGMSATEFGPGTDCNRAQIVTFLYRTYVN